MHRDSEFGEEERRWEEEGGGETLERNRSGWTGEERKRMAR